MNKYIKIMQNVYGSKEYFDDAVSTTEGIEFKFDEDFINILDLFFLGEELFDMSRADKNRIEKYIDFADKKLSKKDRDYKYMNVFDEYLAEIGVIEK